ncbi:MAG: hypothetical protein ACYCZY_09900 [Lacisediminihabitans sp.]
MPWWSWTAIWAGLVLLMVAMLVVFAVRIFRKIVAVFDEFESLSARTEILDRAGEILDDQRQELAILAKYADVRRRRARAREEATARRQSRHQTRLARARALIAVDATQRSWFRPQDRPTRSKER